MRKKLFSYDNFDEYGIILNEDALLPEYVPENILYRDKEINEIVFCLKPLVTAKGNPENIFVYGNTGTGKTVTTKYIGNTLVEECSNCFFIYINCYVENTSMSILTKIANTLGRIIPRRGISKEEVKKSIIEILRKKSCSIFLVLDEFDVIAKKSKEANDLLYFLLRLLKTVNSKISVCLISNEKNIISVLEPRIKSSLFLHYIEFKQYTPEQIKNIIKDRARIALKQGSYDDNVISLITAYAAKNNCDARIALELLLKAAKNAEKRFASKISTDDVREAYKQIEPRIIQKALPSLTTKEKTILEIIESNQPINSGNIYKIAKEKGLKDDERTIRNIIKSLLDKGLIKYEKGMKGTKGFTRIFRVNY